MRFIKSSHKNSKTDDELVADYRITKDELCIEILFNRYCHLVFAVAMNYLHNEEESKDAAIEIFEKLSKEILRYDIKNFGSWIYIVTKNYCYHELKKNKTVSGEDVLKYTEVVSPTETDDESWEKQLMVHLDESLASLIPEQRICVKLFYLEQQSYEEIEKQTGYSYKQVKSYIQNGKRNLKNYLSRFVK